MSWFRLSSEGLVLKLRQVCNFTLNVEVLWQPYSTVFLLDLSFITLNDADHRLARHLGIPINDHVKTILHRANSLPVQFLQTWKSVLLQVDILGGTDTFPLDDYCSVLLNGNFERVCERLVATLLLNTSFHDFTLVCTVVDENLCHLTLFEVLSFGKFNWNHSKSHASRRLFSQEELFVESCGSSDSKHVFHLVLGGLNFLVERLVRIVNHLPILMAHIRLANTLVFASSF